MMPKKQSPEEQEVDIRLKNLILKSEDLISTPTRATANRNRPLKFLEQEARYKVSTVEFTEELRLAIAELFEARVFVVEEDKFQVSFSCGDNFIVKISKL